MGRSAALEPARDGDQQLVADLVAERVVDELEAVEVEEQHGRGSGRGARRWARRIAWSRRSRNSTRFGRPVSASCSASCCRRCSASLAVRDVGLAADDAGGAAVHVAHRDRRARASSGSEPSRCWIRCSYSKCWLAPDEVGLERLRERGAVVGVDAAEPLAAGVAELGLASSRASLPAREEKYRRSLRDVPVPQAVVGALQRERVALLGLGQARERVLVGDRVAERALERGRVGRRTRRRRPRRPRRRCRGRARRRAAAPGRAACGRGSASRAGARRCRRRPGRRRAGARRGRRGRPPRS